MVALRNEKDGAYNVLRTVLNTVSSGQPLVSCFDLPKRQKALSGLVCILLAELLAQTSLSSIW